MKKFLAFFSITFIFFMSCKNDDDDNGNPYLPNVSFDTGTMINTNLPQYNDLNFGLNPVVITGNGLGINGIVVCNVNTGYTAFERSDPGHQLSSCSTLSVDGIIVSCNCEDGNSYDVVTGTPQDGSSSQYSLKAYRVEVNENIIRVYN